MQTRATNGAPMYAEANKFIEQCAHSEWGAWDLFPAGEWTNVDHVTEFSDCFYKRVRAILIYWWPTLHLPKK